MIADFGQRLATGLGHVYSSSIVPRVSEGLSAVGDGTLETGCDCTFMLELNVKAGRLRHPAAGNDGFEAEGGSVDATIKAGLHVTISLRTTDGDSSIGCMDLVSNECQRMHLAIESRAILSGQQLGEHW